MTPEKFEVRVWGECEYGNPRRVGRLSEYSDSISVDGNGHILLYQSMAQQSERLQYWLQVTERTATYVPYMIASAPDLYVVTAQDRPYLPGFAASFGARSQQAQTNVTTSNYHPFSYPFSTSTKTLHMYVGTIPSRRARNPSLESWPMHHAFPVKFLVRSRIYKCIYVL